MIQIKKTISIIILSVYAFSFLGFILLPFFDVNVFTSKIFIHFVFNFYSLLIMYFSRYVLCFITREDVFKEPEGITLKNHAIIFFMVQILFSFALNNNNKDLFGIGIGNGDEHLVKYFSAHALLLSPTILFFISRPFARLIRLEKKLDELNNKDLN